MHLLPRSLPNYPWMSETSRIGFLCFIGFLFFMFIYVTFYGMLYFVNKSWDRIMADVDRLREDSLRTGRRTYSPTFGERGTATMRVIPPLAAQPPSPVSLDMQDQKIVRFNPVKRKGKSTDCVICLDEFVLGQSCRVLEPCNHIFHDRCVNNWLKKNRTCPLCRVDAVRLRIVIDDNYGQLRAYSRCVLD